MLEWISCSSPKLRKLFYNDQLLSEYHFLSSFLQVADFHLDCLECNRLMVYKCFFLINLSFFFVDVYHLSL